MRRSQDKETTAEYLEEKFDRGEDVLDYFDVSKARVIRPESERKANSKCAHMVKRNSIRRAVVREKSARYRKKK